MVTRDQGPMGKHCSEGTKLQLCMMNKFGKLMYSMMFTVNNTVLNNGSLLRE